jgi:hypothetical protein
MIETSNMNDIKRQIPITRLPTPKKSEIFQIVVLTSPQISLFSRPDLLRSVLLHISLLLRNKHKSWNLPTAHQNAHASNNTVSVLVWQLKEVALS